MSGEERVSGAAHERLLETDTNVQDYTSGASSSSVNFYLSSWSKTAKAKELCCKLFHAKPMSACRVLRLPPGYWIALKSLCLLSMIPISMIDYPALRKVRNKSR